MTKPSFLSKLLREGKIKLVDPSPEVSEAYAIKSSNCMKAAKVLLEKNLVENAISDAYYAMYNQTLALFFLHGIKSENHAGSSLILGNIYDLTDLQHELEQAKKERIDKQYYITDQASEDATKEDAEEMIKLAEEFILRVKNEIAQTNEELRLRMREKLKNYQIKGDVT